MHASYSKSWRNGGADAGRLDEGSPLSPMSSEDTDLKSSVKNHLRREGRRDLTFCCCLGSKIWYLKSASRLAHIESNAFKRSVTAKCRRLCGACFAVAMAARRALQQRRYSGSSDSLPQCSYSTFGIMHHFRTTRRCLCAKASGDPLKRAQRKEMVWNRTAFAILTMFNKRYAWHLPFLFQLNHFPGH
jgi:hypothetical protein